MTVFAPPAGLRFQHVELAQRVSFGSGQAAGDIAGELARLDARRVLLVAGHRDRDLVQRLTAGLPVVAHVDELVEHVPVEVAERARSIARSVAADSVVSIGGGSATGLAKAVALTERIPVVAVPTTFAGSEATDVWGLTSGSRKRTGVDPMVLPVAVVYDATLVRTLPRDLAVASGLNALAHAIDALWAPRADPINSALAAEAARALVSGLRATDADPGAVQPREQTLYGAYLAARAFTSAGSGLHHKICHALGGAFALPHAATHAVVLPHVLAFNAPAAPEAIARLARALDEPDVVAAVHRLTRHLRAPQTLRELGLTEHDLDRAAAEILPDVPPDNPRPVSQHDLLGLLLRAWSGAPVSAGGQAVAQ